MSLPVRERGLKCHEYVCMLAEAEVAPRAGAWIEIDVVDNHAPLVGSLPVRERGLKYYKAPILIKWTMSLPVRERGLKYKAGEKRHV